MWICRLFGHKFKLETTLMSKGGGYRSTDYKEVEHIWCERCGVNNNSQSGGTE